MKAADRILDLGPGAGENGGKLIAAGTYDEILHNPASLTGRYLADDLRIQAPAQRRKPGRSRSEVDGRSSTISRISTSAFRSACWWRSRAFPDPVSRRWCTTCFTRRWRMRNSKRDATASARPRQPRGRASKAISTSTKSCWSINRRSGARRDRIRSPTSRRSMRFANCLLPCPKRKKRGFTAGHFSFNIPGGRCETCQGDGTVTVEMQFLADVELICEECKGTRYKPQVLEVRYHGQKHPRSAEPDREGSAEVLRRGAQDHRQAARAGRSRSRLSAAGTVGNHALRRRSAAHETGGAPAAGRRAKRATSEERKGRERRALLYIFDEPTTGLHFDDVSKLLAAFRRLIEAGGSIVVIEHNLDVIKTADWVIDLGPEGGTRGGQDRGRWTSGGDRQAARFIHGKISGAGPERQWSVAFEWAGIRALS